MIDTDKYDGGNGSTLSDGPAPWKIEHFPELYAVREQYHDEDLKLIADAPLLLAEVKRLQKEVRKQSNIVGMINDLVYDGGSHNLTWDEFNEILGGDEE